MITAIIRNKENTLVLDLPHSIYDIYEKLRSIGIMKSPKQIPLTDNEDEDIGVKLFSESDFGRHLLLTLNKENSIADANMLTNVIQAASEDIKEELEQNILYDQYDSMDEVISAVRQMTQDAGPVKAVFFCPLVGNIDEGDGDMFTVGDSYLADSADEIVDALNRYTANDENDMAAYYNKDDGVSEKLTSAVWSVELHGDRLFGRIDCSLKEALTAEETEALRDWLTGQCSDGLCEGFEQQPIDTMDGELFVSFWNSSDDYAMMTESEFDEYLQQNEMQMGGMYYMALLFSAVTVTAGYDETEFTIGGIPKEYDDLVGWTAFDDFMENVDAETEVSVHAEAYLYGGEETVTATPEEVAYLMMRMERDENFLAGHCDNIEDVDFSFLRPPEEYYGMEMS